MKRARTLVLALLAVALLAAASAGGPRYWRAWLKGDVVPDAAAVRVVPGGDGASIPPATPESQGLDGGALETANATARRLGARAFAVARRGHAVHVWAEGGEEGRVRSALLSRLVLGASDAVLGTPDLLDWALGIGERREARHPWSSYSRWRFGEVVPFPSIDEPSWASRLSLELWRPLSARDAWIEQDAAGVPRLYCCLWMYTRDALALSTAIVSGGTIEGQRLLEPAAAERVLQRLDDGVVPRGAEPFGARPARLWRDGEGTRLYFFPAQELVILLIRADESRLADETEIAHQVLRGIVDRTATPDAAPAPRELVPAH